MTWDFSVWTQFGNHAVTDCDYDLGQMRISGWTNTPVGRAVDWLDRKSSPEPDTDGNLENPSYVQVALGAGVEGLLLGGASGAVDALGGGLAGVFVENRTGSTAAGVAAGFAVGAGLAAAQSAWLGAGPMLPSAVLGGLLGAFQTLGGSSLAGVRDSSDMGAIMAGVFMPGASKVVGGLSAAAAQRWAPDSLAAQSAMAAVIGGGLGAAVGALGQGPGLVSSILIGAASGAGGSLIGPRFGQLVRTLSCDAGVAAEAGLKKSGLIDKPLSPMARTLLGAVPIGMTTELAKAAVYADGGWKGILVGGVAQTLQLVDVLRQTGDQHAGSEEEDVLNTLS